MVMLPLFMSNASTLSRSCMNAYLFWKEMKRSASSGVSSMRVLSIGEEATHLKVLHGVHAHYLSFAVAELIKPYASID